MSWFDLIIAVAIVWCIGSFAPVLVDHYRTDMVGKYDAKNTRRFGLRALALIGLIILQVTT
jgi:hypothetical protein